MPVSLEQRGNAAIIWMENPPVNAIGLDIRSGLVAAMAQIAAMPGIDRAILSGRNSIFAAGADAREFNAPPVEPHLPDVIDALEACPVPLIAAIEGVALGGGAELALGCRWRIASPKASIGLPEVTLGVIPGAGGTQRLPRLVGMAAAVDMISQGKPAKATQAMAIGLIDQISDDPVAAACAMDLAPVSARTPLGHSPAPQRDDAAIEAARAAVKKRMRGQVAPLRAIEMVAASADLPFRKGMAGERATFIELRNGEQSRALRHAFFAERGAKPPKRLADIQPLDVRQAIIVGGGTMGAGIAYALDSAGIAVTLVETDAEAAVRARGNVDRIITDGVKRGLIAEKDQAARSARIGIQAGYEGLPPAQLAIEAAFEEMGVKKQVFSALETALPAEAILATNTSYLDVNEIAASVGDPSRVIGLHFFAPAHVMKLLEIIEADATGPVAMATGFALAKKLRKIPVRSGVCDGFIGNRILSRYREAADMILMDGSNPWEIDEAMVDFGYAMGPYETQDLSGLDIAYANRKRKAATRDPKRRYIPIQDRMVQEGRLGKKTGVGWYRYPGGGGKVVDPLIEDLIREEAHFAKVARREFSDEEIRTQLVAAMVNEAAFILEEGIAAKPSDIDLVTLFGYGFPRWRGGLMHHADTVGLASILAEIRRQAELDPVVWQPSGLLERLVAEGRKFADLEQAG